jgi:hypothetical protein
MDRPTRWPGGAHTATTAPRGDAVGAKLIELGDHEERLRALEATLTARTEDAVDAFSDLDA